MRALALFLLAASSPAWAQHEGHPMPASPPAGEKAQSPAADPHAGHRKPAPAAADPHAGHDMPKPSPAPPAPDPHAGHLMPPAQGAAADPHAGHDMGAAGGPEPPVAQPPPEALSGPAHAADAVYGSQPMAEARNALRVEHGSMRTYRLLIDQLEAQVRKGRDGYGWNAEAWYGGDINRLWLKSEGEGRFGESPEHAEVQALFSHAIDPWWNLQAGVRHDFRPDPERTHLVLGIEGLAPYRFEIDAALFLSHKGDLTARFEAEYDQRLTGKLILQPRVELDLAAQKVPEIGIGGGLSEAEAGLRLRYELAPEFAPYVGVQYQRRFGETADFSRARGDDAGGWSFMVGARAWF